MGQLKQLQAALLKPQEDEQVAVVRAQPEWLQAQSEEELDQSRPMPDLEEMARKLKESRNVQNKVLRRWIEDDLQEVTRGITRGNQKDNHK